MTAEKFRLFLYGMAAAIIPAVGAAWAFATVAAEHVMNPHIEGSAARVQVMCLLADVQNQKLKAVCEATGAACDTSLDDMLVKQCRSSDR